METMTPIHPGRMLQEEFLDPLGLSAYALAKALKVTQTRVYDLIKGKRSMSADMARRLALFFGTSDRVWMNLQTRYELDCEKQKALELDIELYSGMGSS